MADTKISDLAAVANVAAANEFAVNEAGTSKKATATQIAAFIGVTKESSSSAGKIDLFEDTDNGTNKVTVIAPASVGSDRTQTLQDATGTIALTSDIPATSIGKQTIWIPASAMIAATTSGPASAQQESATNDINYQTLAFDATADEHAHFNVAFPKSWNLGTVTYQVFWSSSATDTDGVAWGLQGIAISDNEAIDTAWGTPVVVTDDAQSAANELYVTAESGAVTIGGTPADDDLVYFRIFRDVSDANDDLAEDALLIGVKIFYTTDAGTDA